MEEPGLLVRWAIFFFAGGDAANMGLLCLASMVLWSLVPGWGRGIRPLFLGSLFALAIVLVTCGSLPLPQWVWLVGLPWLAFALWEVFFNRGRNERKLPATESRTGQETRSTDGGRPPIPIRLMMLVGFVVWLLVVISSELPFQLWSTPQVTVTDLLVIGDSVTAGLNDGDDTWPRQLSRTADVTVWDASQPGATVYSALQQNLRFDGLGGLVIIEIGGNDMLEGLPVSQFEASLDRLLADVNRPGRSVIMFELPLPPFCAAYGLAQRRQARKHGVSLVPKRQFAWVLTTSGATVDGIHLSDKGQTQMSLLIQSLLGDRLRMGTGTYERLERVSNTAVPASAQIKTD